MIYQAHVRAFLDSTSDGVGDFHGLTTKLEYLEGLGIDTLWLLPFYPFFMIDRALRELDGELHNRAEWIGIPASGLLDLLELR